MRLRNVALPLTLLACLLQTSADARAEDTSYLLGDFRQELYHRGQAFEAEGELERAVVIYQSIRRDDPSWLPAALDLGRALEALGRDDAAEKAYRTAPYEADVVFALGKLYLRTERPNLAHLKFERLRTLDAGQAESLLWECKALVADKRAEQAADVLLEFLERPNAELANPVVLTAGLGAAQALHESGSVVQAAALLSQLVERLRDEGIDDASTALERVRTLEHELRMQERADDFANAADRALTPAQRGALQQARAALATGKATLAVRELTELTREAPQSATTWAALSDARLAVNDVQGAERAVRTAIQLKPSEQVYYERLGDLLLQHYGGQQSDEAVEAYRNALLWPSAPPSVWYRRALAEQESRQFASAEASLRRYLKEAPQGIYAGAAQKRLEDLQRLRPEPPDPASSRRPPKELSESAWRAYNLSLAYQVEGDHERALSVLEVARDSAPGFVAALNLGAELHLQMGHREQALALYQESLQIAPNQSIVQVILADLWTESGDPERALGLLLDAADAGSGDAHLQLAQRWEGQISSWWRAREQLDAYFDAESGGEDYAVARALAVDLDRRIQGVWTLAAVGVGVALMLPILRVGWLRGGKPLSALMDAAPSTWPEVARIASAIRHEVLKHNTTVLEPVADALELGDAALAEWAAKRLYSEHGAIVRFREYVAELQVLARVHGVRLDLRRADPVFGPMIHSIDQLARLEGALRSGKASAANELRGIATQLNVHSYRSLGQLIRSACVMPFEAQRVRDVWRRLCTELHMELPLSVDLPDETTLLRIYPRPLDDILVNLMRNAVEASLRDGRLVGRVGVRVETECDDITGLEWVAIRVQDDAPRRVSTAMIRGRYIDRGLGLAVDLIHKNGGSIHVEDEPGWSKAVVIRLPRAEAQAMEER